MTRHDPERGDRIVAFVTDYQRKHGYAPSIREIAPAVGLSSPSAVWNQLARLRTEGRLSWRDGTPRTLVVAEDVA